MKGRRSFRVLHPLLLAVIVTACGDGSGKKFRVVSASGDIAASVDEFRSLVGGPDNGGAPGYRSSGRRELNWDGVPDELASPNFLPMDFFNDTVEPRARGAFLDTPGDGVQVSADSSNPAGAAVRFGNINPAYVDAFTTYSAERLFSPIDSNVVDLTFFVPGTDVAAVVTGFGAVYTGVDLEGGSSFEYFDEDDESLGRFFVPASEDGLSFLGVAFERAVVARVRIMYGTTVLGPDEGGLMDAAVMDDFIFGEPQPIGCHPDIAPCP